MYVFKTGSQPERPQPATSSQTLVVEPSPKKREMLPRRTIAQLVHSRCFRHVARVANTPKTMTPATPLNGTSEATRLASDNETPRRVSRKRGMNEKSML